MSLLTNSDKLSIVNQHIKTIDYALYNAELDLLELNSEASPNSETLASINSRIDSLNEKRAVLATEAAALA